METCIHGNSPTSLRGGGGLGRELYVSITTDNREFLVISLKQRYLRVRRYSEIFRNAKTTNFISENFKIITELKSVE
jgi:hypothetical protein